MIFRDRQPSMIDVSWALKVEFNFQSLRPSWSRQGPGKGVTAVSSNIVLGEFSLARQGMPQGKSAFCSWRGGVSRGKAQGGWGVGWGCVCVAVHMRNVPIDSGS